MFLPAVNESVKNENEIVVLSGSFEFCVALCQWPETQFRIEIGSKNGPLSPISKDVRVWESGHGELAWPWPGGLRTGQLHSHCIFSCLVCLRQEK